MMGSWCGWSVMVGDGFSIWGSCISGGVVWWRVCCRWLIGELLGESGWGIIEIRGWAWRRGTWCGWDHMRGYVVVELMR